MSDQDFDVVVLGAGPAGETVAGRAADHGLRVAIVERELVGGECSYWGCVPSKTLIRPGDVLAAARRVPGAAEAVTGDIDAGAAFAQRDYMTSGWDDSGQIPWLTDKRITLVRGAGRLSGPRRVSITSAEGASTVLTAGQIVLATGTVPAMPPIPGLADLGAWTNRDITAAKQVPPRLLVLGGGAIGAEMAQAFRRLGSESVTIVEAADRLLVREEPFAGLEVAAALQAEGVTVVTGSAVISVARKRPDGRVVATLANSTTVEADEVLVATGRRPNTANLGLESVGLKPGAFVEVDERMRATGVDGGWLFAVGDVNGRALLTHMGKYQARIAGDVVAGMDAEDRASRSVVPRVTFTDPQVSAVGLTESEARDVYRDVRAVRCGTGDVAGAYTLGNGITGTCQLVVDAGRRVVVGATFTGPGTAELLHAATIAIAGAVTLDDLWHAVPSFPTLSEVWLRLLEAYGL